LIANAGSRKWLSSKLEQISDRNPRPAVIDRASKLLDKNLQPVGADERTSVVVIPGTSTPIASTSGMTAGPAATHDSNPKVPGGALSSSRSIMLANLGILRLRRLGRDLKDARFVISQRSDNTQVAQSMMHPLTANAD
jgi:hypothetical protein